MQSDKPTVFMVGVGERSRYKLVNLFHCAELIVENFETAETFLDSNCWKKPGCVLLELPLPEADGLALQRQLHVTSSRIPMVMLVDPDDIVNAVQALKQGVLDVLEKTVGEQAVFNSVFSALSQAVFFWEKEKQIESARRRLSSLTFREKQILDLVLRGTLNKVIAYELEISMKTVEAHRHNMMEKLSAKNLAELISLVATAGEGEVYCLQPHEAATLGSPTPLTYLTPLLLINNNMDCGGEED